MAEIRVSIVYGVPSFIKYPVIEYFVHYHNFVIFIFQTTGSENRLSYVPRDPFLVPFKYVSLHIVGQA